MNRQMPPALFAAIIIIATFGIFGLIKMSSSGGGLASGEPLAGERVENGASIKELTAKTSAGETFRLSDHKGKVILLNLWATWCGPCVMEMPDLVKLQEEYGSKGFQVVGLSQDDTMDVVIEFAKAHKLNYPVMLLPSESIPDIQALGDISGLPTSFLINKEGKVVWHMTGVSQSEKPFDVISNELKRLL